MSNIFRISQTAGIEGGKSIGGTRPEVGGTALQWDVTIPAGTTDSLVSATFNSAAVQGLIFRSEKNMTLETNASNGSAGGGNTFVLKAGSPLVWSKSDAYFSNPITANVTAFYLTATEATRFEAIVVTT